MENTLLMPSKPDFLRQYAVISPLEASTGVPVAEPETKREPELVDFHLTPLAVTALKDTLTWSKRIAGCISFFLFLELVVYGFALVESGALMSFNALSILKMTPSVVSMGMFGWIIYQCIQFNRQLDPALKFNDNAALPEAFRRQELMFKWLFISIMFSVAKSVIGSVF